MFFSRTLKPAEHRSRLLLSSAVIVVLIGIAGACSPQPPPPPPPASCRGTGSTATRDVQYEQVPGADSMLLSLDYYKPIRRAGCGPAPIVVYVHGGGFVNGDKANKIADKVNLFTGEGWVFASVNYRLSTATPSDPAGQVRYPTHEQDVAAAVGWLKVHSADLGADARRIYLVGHSSGAFLVSLVSTDTSFLNAAGVTTRNVRCTVSLDTEYDVTNQVAQGGSQEVLYRNAFGDDPAVWAKGSPINHTTNGPVRPRFLIFTQGPARRTGQARAFTSALTTGGTPASVIDVSPLTHEEINAAVGSPGDTMVTPPLMSFLRSCP